MAVKKKSSGQFPLPGEAEIILLQILWEHGASTPRQVHEIMAKPPWNKKVVYTAVLKGLQVMLAKGLVSREMVSGRMHLYTAREQGEVMVALLDKFIRLTFRGSLVGLLKCCFKNYPVTLEQFRELKKMVTEEERGS